jgi:hypothetical protein
MTENNQPNSNFDVRRATVSPDEMRRAVQLAAQGFADIGKAFSVAITTAFESVGRSRIEPKESEILPMVRMK